MNTLGTIHEELMRLERVGVFFWRKQGMFRRSPYWVFKDISLSIPKGITMGIIGRNGAGKSTLLSLMAGVLAPDAGKVLCNGCKTTLLTLQAGFTFHLTGRENAILSGMLLGLRKAEIEEKMDEIIDFSELGDFIDHPINTYSSGMLTRLGFSVAYQAKPDLLLLDEIFAVGDESFRLKSMEAMKAKVRDTHSAVIVSHNLRLVREICDQLVWFENGAIRDSGPPQDVVANYLEFVKLQNAGMPTQGVIKTPDRAVTHNRLESESPKHI